jgi:hypothetical protein
LGGSSVNPSESRDEKKENDSFTERELVEVMGSTAFGIHQKMELFCITAKKVIEKEECIVYNDYMTR